MLMILILMPTMTLIKLIKLMTQMTLIKLMTQMTLIKLMTQILTPMIPTPATSIPIPVTQKHGLIQDVSLELIKTRFSTEPCNINLFQLINKIMLT
jgi:hypothetical protein